MVVFKRCEMHRAMEYGLPLWMAESVAQSPVNRNLFEPRVWKSGVNMENVALMERMIALNSKLIESLDLNTRIWTKE